MGKGKGITSALCALCKPVNKIESMLWLGNHKVCKPCAKQAREKTGG